MKGKGSWTAAFLAAALWLTAAEPAYFKSLSVSLEMLPTPLFYTSNVNPSNTASVRNKWLEVGVSFITVKSPKNGPEFLDDVTMEVTLLVETDLAGQSGMVMLVGKNEYYSIALDGKSHLATMFVPPQMIARYLPTVQSLDRSKIYCRVQMYSSEHVLLSEGYGMTKSVREKDLAKFFGSVLKNTKNIKTVKHALFRRNDTPWGLLDANYVELEKRAR